MVGVGACTAAAFGSALWFLQPSTVGTMAGVRAIAGLTAAGVAGNCASKSRTSMRATGVGINGFSRIGPGGKSAATSRLVFELGGLPEHELQ